MRIRVAFLVVLIALSIVACGGGAASPSVRFEPNGAPLTAIEAERLASSTDIASFANVSVAEAPALRSRMLTQLRAEGDAGVRAARLLTVGFPASTPSVPVLVRVSSFEGTSAIVVVEAFGDTGGKLTHRRLWVFDTASGGVVRAASYR